MRLIDINTITLPDKNSEEFRKIDLSALCHYEFNSFNKMYTSNIKTSTITDVTVCESALFGWVQSLNEEQEVLKIVEDTKEPIVLVYEHPQANSLQHHNMKIEVAKGIQASIIEVFKSSQNESAFLINRTLDIKENASLTYTKIQDMALENSLVFNLYTQQASNALCQINAFEYGDGFTLNNYLTHINEKEVKYNINALVHTQKSAYVANLIKTIHNNESSLSNITFKHTLDESSTAVFKAKSIVNEKALYSQAYQHSDTLLLSNDATIFAQPHLEISIDELQASHGATSGAMNKEQLLYLQSRGISKNKAYAILLEAFEATVYNAISNEAVKEYVLAYKGGRHV